MVKIRYDKGDYRMFTKILPIMTTYKCLECGYNGEYKGQYHNSSHKCKKCESRNLFIINEDFQ